MITLTYFIKDIFALEAANLGVESYQTIENATICNKVYTDVTVSGSLIKDVVFEEVIFENCTFFGSQLLNCLFINCIFINCKFQFSKVYDCNFETTSMENCIWGKTTMKETEIISGEQTNSFSFESEGLGLTRSVNLNDFLLLTA
jgi:uncharacterized protein YjbI with pentapeptide repeats